MSESPMTPTDAACMATYNDWMWGPTEKPVDPAVLDVMRPVLAGDFDGAAKAMLAHWWSDEHCHRMSTPDDCRITYKILRKTASRLGHLPPVADPDAWHPMSDGPPTEPGEYIVAIATDRVMAARWDHDEFAKRPRPRWMRGNRLMTSTITHWRMMPAGPAK